MNLRLQETFENTLCLGSTPYSHSIVTRLNDPLPDWATWRYAIRLKQRARVPGLDALLAIQRRVLRRLIHPDSRLSEHGQALSATAALRDTMAASRIMPSRDAARAEWRFGQQPDRTYAQFALTRRNVCVAHVTVSRLGARAEISDALVLERGAPSDSIGSLSDLLTLVIDLLAKDGVAVIGTRVNDAWTAAALRRAGFIRRSEECALGCHFASPTLAEWISDGVPLFLMPADSDF
jgi:hypothetical protein